MKKLLSLSVTLVFVMSLLIGVMPMSVSGETNLVSNPGFELDVDFNGYQDDWTISNGETIVYQFDNMLSGATGWTGANATGDTSNGGSVSSKIITDQQGVNEDNGYLRMWWTKTDATVPAMTDGNSGPFGYVSGFALNSSYNISLYYKVVSTLDGNNGGTDANRGTYVTMLAGTWTTGFAAVSSSDNPTGSGSCLLDINRGTNTVKAPVDWTKLSGSFVFGNNATWNNKDLVTAGANAIRISPRLRGTKGEILYDNFIVKTAAIDPIETVKKNSGATALKLANQRPIVTSTAKSNKFDIDQSENYTYEFFATKESGTTARFVVVYLDEEGNETRGRQIDVTNDSGTTLVQQTGVISASSIPSTAVKAQIVMEVEGVGTAYFDDISFTEGGISEGAAPDRIDVTGADIITIPSSGFPAATEAFTGAIFDTDGEDITGSETIVWSVEPTSSSITIDPDTGVLSVTDQTAHTLWNTTIKVKANATVGGTPVSGEKSVMIELEDVDAVKDAKAALESPVISGNSATITTLPATGIYGTGIKWESNKPEVIDTDTKKVKPREFEDGDVTLTATITKGLSATDTKSFPISVNKLGRLLPEADAQLRTPPSAGGDGDSQKNYGATNILTLGANRHALLRFDLSQIPNNDYLVSAALKLGRSNTTNAHTLALFAMPDNDWAEGTGNGTVIGNTEADRKTTGITFVNSGYPTMAGIFGTGLTGSSEIAEVEAAVKAGALADYYVDACKITASTVPAFDTAKVTKAVIDKLQNNADKKITFFVAVLTEATAGADLASKEHDNYSIWPGLEVAYATGAQAEAIEDALAIDCLPSRVKFGSNELPISLPSVGSVNSTPIVWTYKGEELGNAITSFAPNIAGAYTLTARMLNGDRDATLYSKNFTVNVIDTPYSIVSATVSGTTATAQIRENEVYDSEKELYIAVYGVNNVLVDIVKVEMFPTFAGGLAEVPVTVESGGISAKAFIWTDMNTMQPLAK